MIVFKIEYAKCRVRPAFATAFYIPNISSNTKSTVNFTYITVIIFIYRHTAAPIDLVIIALKIWGISKRKYVSESFLVNLKAYSLLLYEKRIKT